ncbi:KH DOMAIN CONTAINING RNA BINDING PROTEIN [Salix viminalis]|uniref:KH DOMAIN CONTAINING RNA BINDING PROTEIN n=1 Tax=Salix viminalis TaxID=40686 RepID=A0A9Q0TY91_SALVM|nr:KH DOMAIN CONTAINING RNA BINDING PROTEIN [Salix viminalis]
MDTPLPITPSKRSQTEPTQIRILCPSLKTGAVIGKGGSTVRHIQFLTGAKIRLLDDPHIPYCEDRIILITLNSGKIPKSDDSDHNKEDANDGECISGGGGGEDEEGWGPVKKAVVRVFEKIVKGDSEEELSEAVVVTCKVLIGSGSSNQGGNLSKVLEKIRVESGAQVRVSNREQIPACASPGDELILITGSFSTVKKALLSVSSCIQDSPRAETANFGAAGFHGNAMPAQGDLHQWGYGPGNHAADYHPRGYSPNFEEDVVFRLLCQADKVGSLIGKGGSIVRALQNETGASIKIAEGVFDSDERVVVISARENSEQRHSPAQDAVIRVQSRIAEIGFERGARIVARLLVHPQQIGVLLGKGGKIINEMRHVTGASICIFPKEQASKYGSQTEEVVQVLGSLQSVQDALFQITSRLRDTIFPVKPPFSNTAPLPYPPPPFPEMHPPISLGQDLILPLQVLTLLLGPPNLDRGPYSYGGERPGHGPPFESSPRSWTTQPFSNGNLRGGADLGSGPVARNGLPASGNLALSMTSTSVEVVIPQKLLTHVYGESNSNLTQIRQISGANVLIHDPKPGATEGVVVVSGTSDQMRAAQSLIHAFILYGQTVH